MKIINWISNALSENLMPSSKRLISFIFAMTITCCEIYNTILQHRFETSHLLYLLCAIMVLAGVATIPQIASILRPNNSSTLEMTQNEDGTKISKTIEDKPA